MYDYLDTDSIVPGETYYYGIFEYIDSAWTYINAKSIVSADPIDVISQDPFDVVLDRIETGFARLGSGAPLIRTIPPNLDRDPLPVVTVKVIQNEVVDWSLACDVIPDEYLDPDWEEHKGWFGRLTVEIKSYAPSSQIRNLLRKTLQSIIQSNLQVFPSMGWFGINFDQRDSEDYKTNNTPIFVSIAELSFVYITYVGRKVDEVSDVELEFVVEQPYEGVYTY